MYKIIKKINIIKNVIVFIFNVTQSHLNGLWHLKTFLITFQLLQFYMLNNLGKIICLKVDRVSANA